MYCYPNHFSYFVHQGGTPYTIVNDLEVPVTLYDDNENTIARIERGQQYNGNVIINLDQPFRDYSVVDDANTFRYFLGEPELTSGQPILLSELRQRSIQRETAGRNRLTRQMQLILQQFGQRFDLDPQDLQDIQDIINRRVRNLNPYGM